MAAAASHLLGIFSHPQVPSGQHTAGNQALAQPYCVKEEEKCLRICGVIVCLCFPKGSRGQITLGSMKKS